MYSLSEIIHLQGKKCTNVHLLSNKSLELTEVNFSKIRLASVLSLSDYKVNKLYDFGFAQRVYFCSAIIASDLSEIGFIQ